MILQALHSYYLRKMQDPDPARRLPAPGLEEKEIPFVLELAPDGRLVAITDTREQQGKKKVGRRFLVPQGVKKAAGISANLLWDNPEYVLGFDSKGKPKRVTDQFAAFRARVALLHKRVPDDLGLEAVGKFLDTSPLDQVAAHPQWQEVSELDPLPLLTFRLSTEIELVCQRPAVFAAIAGTDAAGDEIDDDVVTSLCLITGESAAIQRLHPAIKNVWGAQSVGANIVSVNNKNTGGSNSGSTPAFASFGKQQGFNSPVSQYAAFTYTTALNSLLAKGSTQRMQVGDASTVFWAQAEEDHDFEDAFSAIFAPQDDPDAHTEQVKALYGAIQSGRFDGATGQRKFFVLGLAPNAARISIRFWYAAPLCEVAHRIRNWFNDLEIEHADFESANLGLKRLVSSACLTTSDRPHGDIEKLPPSISGDLMRSILTGAEIPSLLLNSVIQRCRSEQSKKDSRTGKPVKHVSYPRAAILRAAINRHSRIHTPHHREISVSLDKENTTPSYLAGRMFATFERIQEIAADRDLNRSIRDAYFGSAMATPQSVFPRLIRLNQHHLREIKRKTQQTFKFFDALLLEINEKNNAGNIYPAAQPLREQALFALGYYHQRQAFYTGKAESRPAADADSPAPVTPAEASTL
jgi:CRISPR-associated protein Csd1